MEIQHTPTPWKLGQYSNDIQAMNDEDRSFTIAHSHLSGPFVRANMEFIVRAVNSHEALLKAAKKVIKEYSALPINGMETVIIQGIDDLEDAITLAEGGK